MNLQIQLILKINFIRFRNLLNLDQEMKNQFLGEEVYGACGFAKRWKEMCTFGPGVESLMGIKAKFKKVY
jgi:hypothetical protein